MSKGCIVGMAIVGVLAILLLVVTCIVISTANKEARLRTLIEAKQRDNTSEFDNMWKKITQVAQVTDAQKQALLEIFTGYAEARGEAMKGGGSLMKWITESCPNVDTSTFNNLQNIITSSRDAWTQRQKELIDIHREHTQMFRVFPDNIIVSMLGRQQMEIKVITSTKTEKVFEEGKDDDTKVFEGR